MFGGISEALHSKFSETIPGEIIEGLHKRFSKEVYGATLKVLSGRFCKEIIENFSGDTRRFFLNIW